MADETKDTTKMSDMAIDAELKQLQLEEKRLSVQDLRARLKDRADREESLGQYIRQQQESIEKYNADRAAEQATCAHRMGGTDFENFFHGNDSSYSVVKHTYATGEQSVMCTRCLKEVVKPKDELRQTNPKEFARQMTAFREWWSLPSDNTPSGNVLFVITKHPNPNRPRRKKKVAA